MKWLILVFLCFYGKFTFAELSDGEPRYTIQVASKESYNEASKLMRFYRKYGYTFVYEKNLPCLKKEQCISKKTYRLYVSIFKDINQAKDFLKKIKVEDPNLFKDSLVQNLVE